MRTALVLVIACAVALVAFGVVWAVSSMSDGSTSTATTSSNNGKRDGVTIRMVTVGNPGNASVGVVSAFGASGDFVNNNVAEYSALIAGLEKAVELGVGELDVISDSELMVKQMRGEYRVKNEALRELSLRAGRLGREPGAVRYTAVRREHNKLADQLVNDALDAAG